MFWFIGDQHSSRHSPSAVFQISLDSGDVAEQQKEGISEQLQSRCISLQCTTSNILQTGAANFRTETHSLFTPGLGREAKNSPRWVFWGINALITEFLRFYSFSWIFFCISGIQRNQFLLCTTGPKDSSGVTKNSVWPCPLYVDYMLTGSWDIPFLLLEQNPQSGVEAFPISEIPQELCARRAEHQNSPLHKTSWYKFFVAQLHQKVGFF